MLNGSVLRVLCGLCSRLGGGYVGGEDVEPLEERVDMRMPDSPGNLPTDARLCGSPSRAGNSLIARTGTARFTAPAAETSINEANARETNSSSSTPPAIKTTHTTFHPAQKTPSHHSRTHPPSNPHGHQTPFKPHSTTSTLPQSSQTFQTSLIPFLGTRDMLTQNTGGYKRPAVCQGITRPSASWRAGAIGTPALGSRGLLAGMDCFRVRVNDVVVGWGLGRVLARR
ncbi:hypothetical protein IAQ61_008044 [Plenodomus lingam]|uniref:uncharacterized protein n=1 Tax=Leptosphaeria maculans TaxID=5022 RepID=UPI00332B2F94|nr:hypothetical protein IAQ61_008044 [Plenodomus lingam]